VSRKLKLAIVYNKNNKQMSGEYFDGQIKNYFVDSLEANDGVDIEIFNNPAGLNFDKIEKQNFDGIMLFDITPWGAPEHLVGLDKCNVPKFLMVGDCHHASSIATQYGMTENKVELIKKYNIDCCYYHHSEEYFHEYYPKEYRYKQIYFGIMKDLYERNSIPWAERAKDRILLTGSLSAGEWYYNLRYECARHPRVQYANRTLGFTGEKYAILLSHYRAAIAATSYQTTGKYFEIPAAGCLTFMEVTKRNHGILTGYKDGDTAIFINEDNYMQKFNEFLEDPENPKWERIAKRGQEFTFEHHSDQVKVKQMINMVKEIRGEL